MSIEITFLYCHSIENVTLAEPPQRQRRPGLYDYREPIMRRCGCDSRFDLGV